MTTDNAIPETLQPIWARYRQSLPASVTMSETVLRSLPRVWLCSEFVTQSCLRHPAMLASLLESNDLLTSGPLSGRVGAALHSCRDEEELVRAVRHIRRREMVRIAWRDLSGWASLDETLHDLSSLADACVDKALTLLTRWHVQRYGIARNAKGDPQSLVVLGMGKLGAQELNFSSDIDLILAYPENGNSDGSRALDNEEYFVRLGQRLVRVLDETTSDGFAFRVDLRLRPFGDSGSLAMAFTALETYYQNHGREWERYALIKARPVAGDIAQGEMLLQALRPFVYRRYLDFNAFASLREMKQLIMRDVARRGLDDNIKLGRGGIREIEFTGQLFQLIRGGREPLLRKRGIVTVLRHLGQAGHLNQNEICVLIASYEFLRRIENRLQEYRDEQTHELPPDQQGRERLAWAMDFKDWPAFKQGLEEHRREVRRIFDLIFAAPWAKRDQPQRESPFAFVWRGTLSESETARVLDGSGFTQTEDIVRLLRELRDGPLLRALGDRGRKQLDELLPRLFDTASNKPDPSAVFLRLLRVVEAVAKRSTYLALLLESPTTLDHLARLASGSAWLADMLARMPWLLDELIDPRIFNDFPSRESLHTELGTAFADVAADDLERQMDTLRQFQQATVVRVAAADISGNVPLMKVSDFLTWTAEQVILKALDIAWQHMRIRHGDPWCCDLTGARPARFGIIAYGKLAGIELGYGSDLDLVFLHDSAGEEQQSRGARPLENHEYFTRLAQRVINILSIPTGSGLLYQVDTRLRPSGAAGLIVTSLEAFSRYQRDQAWTWEHQALLRARPVAGDTWVGDAFNRLRREILSRPRDAAALQHEVALMRARMLKQHVQREQEFDLKLDPGGLTDIEFLVQYWVLRHAAVYPSLLDWTDNIRNLEGLVEVGILTAQSGAFLADTYRFFRGILHRCTLQSRPALIPVEDAEPLRGGVRRLWDTWIGAPPAGDIAGYRSL